MTRALVSKALYFFTTYNEKPFSPEEIKEIDALSELDGEWETLKDKEFFYKAHEGCWEKKYRDSAAKHSSDHAHGQKVFDHLARFVVLAYPDNKEVKEAAHNLVNRIIYTANVQRAHEAYYQVGYAGVTNKDEFLDYGIKAAKIIRHNLSRDKSLKITGLDAFSSIQSDDKSVRGIFKALYVTRDLAKLDMSKAFDAFEKVILTQDRKRISEKSPSGVLVKCAVDALKNITMFDTCGTDVWSIDPSVLEAHCVKEADRLKRVEPYRELPTHTPTRTGSCRAFRHG